MPASQNTSPGLGDGYTKSPLISDSESGGFSALLPDGKILLAGTGTGYGCSVRRFHPDGSLDTTFGVAGVATQPNNTTYGSWFTTITGIIVQPDGKILLTGDVLVRFNQDGSIDKTFGTSGILNVLTMAAQSAVVQSDGKILVAGTDNAGSDFALTRYDASGVLDTAFGTAGTVTTNVTPGNSFIDKGQCIALQVDSKILVAGYTATSLSGTGYDFSLVRYNSNGTLDTTFSGDGKLTTSVAAGSAGNDYAHSVLIQADNKIVVAGESYNGSNYDLAITRYNTDGTVDNSFGVGGTVKTAIGQANDYGYQINKQPDGKLLVTGWFYNGLTNICLVRYNVDGTLDTSFGGGDGVVTQSLSGYEDKSYSVLVQNDGKIVVTGTSWVGTVKTDLYLMRFLSDGAIDYSFGTGNLPSRAYIENQSAVVLDSRVGVFDQELVAANNFGGASLTLTRHGNGNSQDQFSGAGIVEGQSSGNVSTSGITIGSYAWSDGTLTISFNSSATSDLVNSALKTLAYKNTSDAPPASVQIDWIFNDGNQGGQGLGGALSITKSQTITITPLNDYPTGSVTIQGDPVVGQVLTATNSISDPDGLGNINYQWQANGVNISGATSNTLTLSKSEVGAVISVWASYTDLMGSRESMSSVSTAKVANINDAPTGSVAITGLANRGEVLTASNTLADTDGLGTISYQWKADGIAIAGANQATLTLSPAEVGKSLTVDASYVDQLGTLEHVSSSATSPVSNNAYPTFYVSNGSTVPLSTPWTGELSCALQADGNILVAGTYGGDFAVARFLRNGTLDASFGGGGIQTVNLGFTDSAYSIAVQGDSILVAGGSNGNFALAKLTASGSLDTSFGKSGIKIIDFGSFDTAYSIAVQADGLIVVVGRSGGNFALARLNAAGVLDTAFSGDGLQTFLVSGSSNSATDVAIQADGKTIAVGSAYVSTSNSYDFAIARLDTLGNLDNTFSADGKDTQGYGNGPDYAYAVAIQPDGKVLVGGSFSDVPTLIRYNPDGSLDTSFNGSGQLKLVSATNASAPGLLKGLRDIDIAPDGKILITGSSGYAYAPSSAFAVARLTPSGALDTSFSDDGYATVAAYFYGAANNFGYGSIVTPEGQVVVVGTVTSSGSYLGVARLNADGSPDETFAAINTLNDNPTFVEGGVPVTLDASVKIYDANLTTTHYGGASLTMGRHGGVNPQDHFTVYDYLVDGSRIKISGQDVAAFDSNPDGSARISFSSNATQTLVNSVLSHIQYSNSSDAPASSVLIDWTFSDGNSGAQGLGGALTTTGTITVSITPTNDAPVITSAASISIPENTSGVPLVTLAGVDPDGGPVTWEISGVNGALPDSFSFDSSTGTLSLVKPLDYEALSSYELLVTAHDASYNETNSPGFGVATYQTVTITVVDVNDAPTFGVGDGISLFTGPVVASGYGSAFATDLAIDGKNTVYLSGVTSGYSPGSVWAASYNADGTLNNAFSSDGIVTSELTSSIGNRQASRADAVALQSDGKIVIAGSTQTGSGSYVAVARYNADGTLDSSFSADGWTTTTLGAATNAAWDVAIQQDGKIVVAGEAGNGNNQDIAVFRFNKDGSLDASFSYDGKASYDFFGRNEIGKAVALQNDGKMLVAGYYYPATGGSSAAEIIRFNADGSLDTYFSGDGLVSDNIGLGANSLASIAVQSDGKILAAGQSLPAAGVYSGSQFALFRYNANGTLDTSFSEDGKQTADFGLGGSQGATNMLIQQDGKIVLVGYANNQLAVARFNTDGALDATFGQAGKLSLKINEQNTAGLAIAQQLDGKLLVTGGVNASDTFVLRFNPNGTLDPSFDSNHTLNGVSWFYQGGSPVILDADVLVSDDDLNRLGYQDSHLTLVRHGGANAEDLFSGAGIVAGQDSGAVSVAGTVVGDYRWVAGQLDIGFNSNASQNLVGKVMQSLAYSSTSYFPPEKIQIDWTFTDGKTVGLAGGAALSVSGSSTVQVLNLNDVPTGRVTITGAARLGQMLTAVNDFSDADGIPLTGAGAIHYQWLADGNAISGATNNTFTLSTAEIGKVISVQASYTDLGGTTEALTSTSTTPVQAVYAGAVIDGYVAGSTVFVDTNGDLTLNWTDKNNNGTFDVGEGETWATTDGLGGYVLTSSDKLVGVNIVAKGGMDVTSHASMGLMLAPVGVSYITPIATLYAFADRAKAGGGTALLSTLGLSASDLNYDPVAQLKDQGVTARTNAAKVLQAGASLLTMVHTTSALVLELSHGVVDATQATKLVWNQMASLGAGVSGLLSSDAATSQTALKSMLTASLVSSGVATTGMTSLLDASASAISAVTTSIQKLDATAIASGDYVGLARLGQETLAHTLTDVAAAVELGGVNASKALSNLSASFSVSNIPQMAMAAKSEIAAPMSGIIYDWKSHTLLKDVSVNLITQGDGVNHLYELRNVHLTSSGDVTAEVWANLGTASVQNLHFDLGLESGVTGTFTADASSMLGFSSILGDQLGHVGFGAISATHSLTGSVKVGLLSLDLPTGTTLTSLRFLSGDAGSSALVAYAEKVGALQDTTDIHGAFDYPGLDAGQYSLELDKALTSSETGSQAISSADALSALKMAVGRNPNEDAAVPLAASPYQFIAADVNGDGRVSSADALAILKMTVSRSDAPSREWLFVREDEDFWNEVTHTSTITRTSVAWDNEPYDVSSPSKLTQNWVAVLKGDVNGSWSAPAASEKLPDAYFTNLVAHHPTSMQLSQWGVIGV